MAGKRLDLFTGLARPNYNKVGSVRFADALPRDSTARAIRPLKILFLSAEVVPFAKTGGLADVAGALPKALQCLGHDIRVFTPRYQRTDPARFGLKPFQESLDVPMDSGLEHARILAGALHGGTPIFFVESAHYFDRERIYGYPDDGERFIFFSRSAIESVRADGWQPDIIHCNDWHTGIVPNWLQTIYRDDPLLQDAASVYTIHNLAYQGVFGMRILEVAGIAEQGFVYPQITELAEVVDLMGRGILFADVVSTVSEHYAREILTEEFGERLDPLLRERRDRLFGITNGIDYEEMDPANDPQIAAKFSADSLDRRIANKLALQREAHLPEQPDTPLIGMISRLVDQKGFDIFGEIVEPLLRHHEVQFVLLGTGDQHYHDMFQRVAQQHPEQAAVFLTFNALLAQKIYAGADLFLMPSRYEPCGLGQMIAMRYGSIPIVRATGGLVDTVEDYDARADQGVGYVFEAYDHWPLYTAIVRAMEGLRYQDRWRAMQRRAMAKDFSWNASALKYVELYQRACDFHRADLAPGSRAPAKRPAAGKP